MLSTDFLNWPRGRCNVVSWAELLAGSTIICTYPRAPQYCYEATEGFPGFNLWRHLSCDLVKKINKTKHAFLHNREIFNSFKGKYFSSSDKKQRELKYESVTPNVNLRKLYSFIVDKQY